MISSWSFAQEAAISPIPTKDPAAGLSQAELAKRWWQWLSSFGAQESPANDHSGAHCAAGQDGPIWYLAGAFGSDPVQRTCHIPAGKILFFPIITYMVVPTDGSLTCAEAIKGAREMTDAATDLHAELDGKAIDGLLQRRVASSGCFNAGERAPGKPNIAPSAANGYWLALPALPKGRHKLRFGGTLPSLGQEINYTLITE